MTEVLARLTASLHAQIPMTAFLQIRFAELAPDRIALAAPLGPSTNHRGTAFGPGVFTTAALAPWLLLVRRAWAERVGLRILLREASLGLHRPIDRDYEALCDALPELDLERVRRGERLRLTASSHVRIDDGAPAATYTAHYTLVAGEAGDGDLQLPFPEDWR